MTSYTKQVTPPKASRSQWETSFDVEDFAVPTGREEAWKFTPVRKLKSMLAGDSAGAANAVTTTVSHDSVVAGELAHGEGVRGKALVPADRAAVLATAHAEKALHLRLDADTEYDEPIVVEVHGEGADMRSNSHYVIEALPHSTATVVLRHTGAALHSGNVEVVVGDGAQLRVISVQLWDKGAVHLGQHDALVGRDASYRHVAVSLGGDIIRLNANVNYAGPGGAAELYGAYLAGKDQHVEHRSFADHSAPHCRSEVIYKGALNGANAHTVWVGDVQIQASAVGTDTFELNRNLILVQGARADSVPNLEIETGDIKNAGHASATGRFDDDQLFYLMARGISEQQARKLVVRGFFDDIIGRIGITELHDELMSLIDAELDVVEV